MAVAVGGWLWREVVSDLRKLEDNVNAHVLDGEKFKRHVAETYPTKFDLGLVESKTRETLSRLHDRIDVVSEDIKEILAHVGNGKK